MRLKVAILAHENVQHWAPLYIEAFRERCEVVTLGRAIDPDRLEAEGWAAAPKPARPNDIAVETGDAVALLSHLPAGWTPDLVVAIQSGEPGFSRLAEINRPSAYISIDTWHDWRELMTARQYEFVFPAQRVFEPYLAQGGAAAVHWLPLACAPRHHRPVSANLLYDIVFVGTTKYVVNEERIVRLKRLSEQFKVARQEDVGPEDMCRVYCSGRLSFNSSVAQDVNMRVFEVLAMGRPLLANRDAAANGLTDLFEEDIHFIGYDDSDLLTQARRGLDDPAWCAELGRAGRALVLEKHTYLHRVDEILRVLAGAVPRLGQFSDPLFREGEELSGYIPFGAGTVIDIGMGLDRSKVALRGRGVTRCIGIAANHARIEKRRGRYDEAVLWPVDQTELPSADALCWTAPTRHIEDLHTMMAYGHGTLKKGGTLILRLEPGEMDASGVAPEFSAWDVWAYERGFHLLVWRPPSVGGRYFILILRKFTPHRCGDASRDSHAFPRWPTDQARGWNG